MFCSRIPDGPEEGWHVNLEIQSFYLSSDTKLPFKIQNQIGRWYKNNSDPFLARYKNATLINWQFKIVFLLVTI